MKSLLDRPVLIPENGVIMNDRELRKEYRIPAHNLPEQYTRFTILLGQEDETEVQTTDLSLNGFGFLSVLPEEAFIPGSRLVLYPLGKEQPLYGIVVHSARNDRGTRVGIKLQTLGGYNDYVQAIQKILDDLDVKTGS